MTLHPLSEWHGRFATRFARINSRETFAIESSIFTAHHADSHESLEFPIRANHQIHANRTNRFARITPLSPLLTMQIFDVLRCDPDGLLENRFRAFGPK